MALKKDCHTKSELDLCIFHDIFRRADKNDDGAISWAEFVCYFSDGIMTDDGMRALFSEIDTHHTNNIDTQELCSYFSSHLGSHAPVFRAAAALCSAVSHSMKSLAQTHAGGSLAAQFIDRFLLREMCSHLEAQHRVLKNALESLERQGRNRAASDVAGGAGSGGGSSSDGAWTDGEAATGVVATSNCQGGVLQGGVLLYKRLYSAPPALQNQLENQLLSQHQILHQHQHSESQHSQTDSASQLHREVEKLQRLVERLEAKTAFFTGRSEETVMDEEEPVILVVRRRVTLPEEQLGSLQAAVKQYAADLDKVASCLFLSVRQYRETGGLVIYEFWESLGSWRKFLPTPVSKELRKCIVECSEAPESTETLLLPSEWWKQLEH